MPHALVIEAPAKRLYAFRPARNTLTVPKACCLLLCALLVWCCVDAPAASVAPPASPYWIDVWETDDGLPQSSILSRSEEHTSELQSQSNLVCRLLLEKKKKQKKNKK